MTIVPAYKKDDFNPRSLCRERLFGYLTLDCVNKFQSTLPMQGATTITDWDGNGLIISIHAPYAGSDSKSKQLSVIILLNIISFANRFANNKTISCIFAI